MQFDTQFVEAAKIGEVLVSRPRVIRATRSLIFMTTELTAGERCVAMASGVFKIMKGGRESKEAKIIFFRHGRAEATPPKKLARRWKHWDSLFPGLLRHQGRLAMTAKCRELIMDYRPSAAAA